MRAIKWAVESIREKMRTVHCGHVRSREIEICGSPCPSPLEGGFSRPKEALSIVKDVRATGTVHRDKLTPRWGLNILPDKKGLPELLCTSESIECFTCSSDR